MNTRRSLFTITLFVCSLLVGPLPSTLSAQGRIILPWPDNPRRPVERIEPVRLTKVEADVKIINGAGTVKLDQTFYNPNGRQREGQYLFMLPNESQIHDFHLYVDGEKTQGEILDKNEARRIYNNIVRGQRDPALLEYVDHRLFRASIFPFPERGERRIEMTYATVLDFSSETYRLTIPIKQSGQAIIDDYTMHIDLETDQNLGTVYSPTHTLEVKRNGNRKARIHMEAKNMEASKNFVLYYTLDTNEINANLLSFRPRTDKDGYFLMMAHPSIKLNSKRAVIPKDIIFVIDASGSMQGKKMEQAKEALQYCIRSLNSRDRFEIIRFSSSLKTFSNTLNLASSEAKQNAESFIENIGAAGGTNIDAALRKALRTKASADKRPTSVLFLTDGLPTSGETDVTQILKNVKSERRDEIRIFNFGVGFDVNTFLLDKLAADMSGSSTYVKPGENLEEAISTFYAQNSTPALTDPEIKFDLKGIYDVYPVRIPDIFLGQRVMILGRYKNSGSANARLSGEQAGKKRSFTYDVKFDHREKNNDFIATLWANHKVSHLLEDIRFNGENHELVTEVKRLGEEYGIVTPYTSYLVTEQEREISAINARRKRGDLGTSFDGVISGAQENRQKLAEEDEEAVGGKAFYDNIASTYSDARSSSGKGAVLNSRIQKKVYKSEKAKDVILTTKRISGKVFKLTNGVWKEQRRQLGGPQVEKEIVFLSDNYFELLDSEPKLADIFALGDSIEFTWKGTAYKIIKDRQ
ncbi:MAG: VIT domain-containing protein [Calditrichia bacterium]